MNRTILVVDDEPDILFTLRMLLGLAGDEVLEASSGEDALDILKTHRPDAILLDVGLPGIDGWEVLSQLRESGAFDLRRIVLCTAHVSPSSPIRAAQYGCGYVAKPFQGTAITEALDAAIQSAAN